MPVHRRTLAAVVACSTALTTVLLPATAASGASRSAPGGPGTKATAAPADSHGFGTSRTLSSKVWFTLEKGGLGEVYYPDLGTPALRVVELLVTDGKSFVEREQDATVQTTQLLDNKGLTYRQVNTERSHRWRVTKTYVTDPRTSTVTIDIRFQSLTGRPYSVFVYDDPSLSNTGDDDLGRTAGGALLSNDAKSASALIAKPALTRTSTGFLGKSDGWTDLKNNKRMDWTYSSSGKGNVVQTGHDDPQRHDEQEPDCRDRVRSDTGFGVELGEAHAGHGIRNRCCVVRRRLGRVPAVVEDSASPGDGARAGDVHLVRHGACCRRGQDLPRRLCCLTDDAVGLGQRARDADRCLPPGLVARPVRDRDRSRR